MSRESMQYDCVIVGAGPAGLACAIRLKQLAAEKGRETSVCVLEKGSEIGAHILSGAVMDPRALDELFPDWKAKGAPLNAPVTEDRFLILGEAAARRVPNVLLPACFRNHGNYVISLGNLTRWLGQQAESLGVEIFPGFAAAEVLYDQRGAVMGVATGDMGIDRKGEKTDSYQPGMELHAKYTFFAEGCRGSLGKQLQEKFALRIGADPQVYGIGLKELWDVRPEKHKQGLVVHTAGWPLDRDTYGGSFLYHLENNQIAVGFVVGLAYTNPYLSPYEEFQRFKTHPSIRKFLEGGKRIAYGARALTEGGWQAIPKLAFPGGALIGCAAGFMNVPRIKGSHNAMLSGMMAAEAAFAAIEAGRANDVLEAYPTTLRSSEMAKELKKVRNVKPLWSRLGTMKGVMLGGIDMWLNTILPFLPHTLKHKKADYASL
ncbi:MAG: NAD(P)/FAD-dependent oxidoreductase, partial [Sphingomonadaceae bacterium]